MFEVYAITPSNEIIMIHTPTGPLCSRKWKYSEKRFIKKTIPKIMIINILKISPTVTLERAVLMIDSGYIQHDNGNNPIPKTICTMMIFLSLPASQKIKPKNISTIEPKLFTQSVKKSQQLVLVLTRTHSGQEQTR